MTLTLADRLLGRTGWHRRTYPVWQAMEQRVAAMDDQDELITRLARQRDEALQQRDEQRTLAAAAAVQVEEFRNRVNDAEKRAERAEKSATRLRAEIANLKAVTVPMYATDADTRELHLPAFEVMSLQARGAA